MHPVDGELMLPAARWTDLRNMSACTVQTAWSANGAVDCDAARRRS